VTHVNVAVKNLRIGNIYISYEKPESLCKMKFAMAVLLFMFLLIGLTDASKCVS